MNKFDYKNLTPFKWFVLENFPFIEADFDALTEWQLFCKLGKEINKIIDSQNVVGTEMEKFSQAFIELKNYVDNYFDNLDVQNEINNKLNDMVEDGTLQEIISIYLNSKAIFGFDNIESMKISNNLINGSFAKTMGYHTKNDGGSALYKIREITNDDVVDNMLIIQMTNENLVAELINIGKTINVKQLGAYGDDTHDDLIPLQKAFDLSNNNKVVIPNGTYLITENLIISDKNNILINAENSIIHYNGSDYAIRITKTTNSTFNFGIINAPSGSCLKLESLQSDTWCQYITINFNVMKALNNCIHAYCELGWVNEIRVNKGKFETGQNGILLENNRDANSITSWNFNEIGFEGVTNALHLIATQGSISQLRVENCRYAEIITYGGKLLLTSGVCKRITINGDVNIQNPLISVTSDTEDLFLNAPCVFYSKTYIHGGYYKNNIFIPNDANLFNLIDGNEVTEETDMNSLTNPGSYLFTSTKINGMAHTPVSSGNSRPARLVIIGTYSTIFSPQSPNSRALQILFNADHVFVRSFAKSNNTYSFDVWYELGKTQVVI